MRIKSLTIYPLKAARGHSLSEAVVQNEGLADDRRWVLVNRHGKFVSQRSLPRLARLGCSPQQDGSLILDWDGRQCELRSASGGEREVEVWKDRVLARDWGEEAHRFLSDLAQEEIWLCEALTDHARRVSHTYTAGTDVPYYFADGFPFLVIAEESLHLLNQKLAEQNHAPLAMDRFRPNIVIEGWQAHAEDTIQTIRIGSSVELRLAKPCSRCTVTTVDQESGEMGKEPLRTLASYRRDPEGGIFFGQNAYLLKGKGEFLRVGDPVVVLS